MPDAAEIGMPLSKAGRSGVDVYIHTDGDVVPPPKGSNFRAHSFWAGQKRNLTALRERWNCCWRQQRREKHGRSYQNVACAANATAKGM